MVRPQVVVSEQDAGKVISAPPTFLERWGVVFLAVVGGWILLVGSGVLIYYLIRQPALPSLAGFTPEQSRDALVVHRQVVEQWRDSVSYVFDMLVTKTTLPIVTLLLGYLFGKKTA